MLVTKRHIRLGSGGKHEAECSCCEQPIGSYHHPDCGYLEVCQDCKKYWQDCSCEDGFLRRATRTEEPEAGEQRVLWVLQRRIEELEDRVGPCLFNQGHSLDHRVMGLAGAVGDLQAAVKQLVTKDE